MPNTKTNPMHVAEQVITEIMDSHPEKPIRVNYYRGLRATPFGLRIANELVDSAATRDGWFVNLNPGLDDVAICAMEPTPFGTDIIGRQVADCLFYPKNGAEVDAEALTGAEFRARLLAEIDEKIAVIEAARA